jgi:hypothetical protein
MNKLMLLNLLLVGSIAAACSSDEEEPADPVLEYCVGLCPRQMQCPGNVESAEECEHDCTRSVNHSAQCKQAQSDLDHCLAAESDFCAAEGCDAQANTKINLCYP